MEEGGGRPRAASLASTNKNRGRRTYQRTLSLFLLFFLFFFVVFFWLFTPDVKRALIVLRSASNGLSKYGEDEAHIPVMSISMVDGAIANNILIPRPYETWSFHIAAVASST